MFLSESVRLANSHFGGHPVSDRLLYCSMNGGKENSHNGRSSYESFKLVGLGSRVSLT